VKDYTAYTVNCICARVELFVTAGRGRMDAENFKRRPNELSLSRVKTIMKSSPDAENVSQESVYLVTKATELFIKYMVQEAYKQSNNAKTLEYKHVSELVQTREVLAFLREIVPRKCSLRDIQENLRRRGLETKRAGVSSSSSDVSLYSDESSPSSPEPRDTKAVSSSVSQETKSVSSAYSPELKSVKPVLTWTRPSLSNSLSTEEFSSSRKPETLSGMNTYASTSSLPASIAHTCCSDVVLRPGTPSTITLSSSSREMSCGGSPSPTLSLVEPGPSSVPAAASPLSVMSASSGSGTPSPSPSYSSLSPQLHSSVPAQGEDDMVNESVLSDSSVSGFYQE